MKPVVFDFVRASSLAEATRLLVESKETARVIAGAQSLGPMLNLRLVRPRILIDITGIPELTRVEDAEESVTIGACVTTANIEDKRLPGRGLDSLPAIAARIAYRAVRNRGTIGGSLCHADPAADWPSALSALGAHCLITGAGGKRELPVEEFVTGAFENALGPGEILEAIRIPRLSARGRCGFYKVCRKAGEFASAIAAVLNDRDRGQFRVVIGAGSARPIVLKDGARLRGGGGMDAAALLRLLEAAGVADRIECRQKIAAVVRAYAQTVN
jgi:aerobic carbon-monoxide dehydrogenase medium subunit